LAGAIFGTIVAGFVLLPILGVRTTIFTAAAINVLIGIVSILALVAPVVAVAVVAVFAGAAIYFVRKLMRRGRSADASR